MVRSIKRYGQITPVIVCLRDGSPELIDGFKRLAAARALQQRKGLVARLVEADDRAAKVAIYALNRGGGCTCELEEAWIIHALVREDCMTQIEVAELLGRHKSWVCRRLALLEKLGSRAREDLRLGLLSPTTARQITRLPEGNQGPLLDTVRRESLTTHELQGVVDLLLISPTPTQREFILDKPRQALEQAQGVAAPSFDPRLSAAGNRLSKRLGLLLDLLGRIHNWIEHRNHDHLSLSDQTVLRPGFERLADEASAVAELCTECLLRRATS